MKSHVAVTTAARIIESDNFGIEEQDENIIVFLVSCKIKKD